MPELPEVESVVRAQRQWLVGRRFVDFVSHWPRNAAPSAAAVREALVGRMVADVWRRAKYIVVTLAEDEAARPGSSRRPEASAGSRSASNSGRRSAQQSAGYLLIHLRMSGRLEWFTLPKGDGATAAKWPAGSPAHVRAEFEFDNGGRLLFCDARKFGRIAWTRDLTSVTAHLGVEPLDDEFRPAMLRELLQSRSRALKPLLLDQSLVAGIGNIYADEALHRAGLHPLTPSDRVEPEAVKRLCSAIRAVLRDAIRRNGTSFDWVYPSGTMQDHLRVYGRTGAACRACGSAIVALRVGQRGTHICPRCQPLPRGRAAEGRALRSGSARV
ncbi:MAG: bifunctional DNA-formamidopyrimidine glycosylase/DNA-(apurinic or apyrimidinic site) lyase [Planctomycetia bacterium]|nr:MAG: bifunctional DNA-formamidopyrimidine glycosylase/DNA-(apurinic or apyrimidinic site) lyase [Planctomycetia bacterium]